MRRLRRAALAVLISWLLVGPATPTLAQVTDPADAALTVDDLGAGFRLFTDTAVQRGFGLYTTRFVLSDPATFTGGLLDVVNFVSTVARLPGPAEILPPAERLNATLTNTHAILVDAYGGDEAEEVSGPPIGDDSRYLGSWVQLRNGRARITTIAFRVGDAVAAVSILGAPSPEKLVDLASIVTDRIS